MKRILVLVSTVALALLLVGGVAASKQRQEQGPSSESPNTTTTDKRGGDVSIESFTQKASFASGSGNAYLRVAVSDHGNLLAFESPQGQQAVTTEGYVLCSNTSTGNAANGYDVGGAEFGFGTPTFAQPNGAGTFPLTVTRNTTDGKFQLKQVWAKPDAAEKDVTVTMTVTNRSSATINNVLLTRNGDIDAGAFDSSGSGFTDRGARTRDSAIQWDDYSDPSVPFNGVVLTALTPQTSNFPAIEAVGSNLVDCSASGALTTPTSRQDLQMSMQYFMGNIPAGASRTVKYQYGRM
jgi:hypothetical protein